MRKRFLSLLCVLALCLGLLPVTVLAAEEIKLFIGGQQITESGCYANQNGTWTKVEGTGPSSGQFYYDAATFTLTLNQAKITHDRTVKVAEGYTYEGSVIAFSQTADVFLKIVVSQGTSTITGTGGIRVESTTGNASLSIKGSGSLDVEPKGSNSGITLCSSKNTNLDIDGADVTASSPAQYGVYLISSIDTTSTSTITVNNGSLTTGGNGNVGIYYYWSGTSNAGTSSLTVSGNAVVDTRNSQIMAQNKETVVQVGAGSDGNGGIVFNGKSGTVYGDVTLEDDLEIASGETLTIPDDSSLNSNGKLTNNGTIINNGTLTGDVGGNGTVTPKITTDSLSDGTVDTAYNQTLAATGNNITWSLASGSTLPAGLALDESTGTISGTPTAEGTSTFTVTATNASGSDSKVYTLTINPAPILVTGVTLKPTSLSLFTGDTATLTATVEPSNATNPNVTWSSDRSDVATVDSGVVTAVGEGEATITVKTTDGSNISDTCTVTVTQSTYSISADTKALDFGSVYTGYTQPAAKTVTITNDVNQQVTVTLPTANDFVITAGQGFTDSTATLAPHGTATFAVQPKAGLAVGTYSENITISDSGHVTLPIPATFTVRQYSGGGDSDPTYSITLPSRVTGGELKLSRRYAEKGETVTITAIPDEGYELDTLTVTDSKGKEIDLTHKGGNEYTFKMPAGRVEIEVSFREIEVELPFTDVPEDAWYADAAAYVYEHGLMAGTSATTFAPDATTSRSMIATILWRMAGSPVVNYAMDYTDVGQGQWYSEAIRWAASEGIVGGYGNGLFGTNDPITREQFAVMLYRYAQEQGYDVSIGENTNILSYTDVADLSEYAISAMQWAVGAGIINGTGDGSTLTPRARPPAPRRRSCSCGSVSWTSEAISRNAGASNLLRPGILIQGILKFCVGQGAAIY